MDLGKYDRAEKTLKLATIAATVGLTIGWIVVQLYPETLVSMFNKRCKSCSYISRWYKKIFIYDAFNRYVYDWGKLYPINW